MIGQYLSNTNEKVTVSILQNILETSSDYATDQSRVQAQEPEKGISRHQCLLGSGLV